MYIALLIIPCIGTNSLNPGPHNIQSAPTPAVQSAPTPDARVIHRLPYATTCTHHADSARRGAAGRAHGLGAARYAGACATTRAACSDNFRESKAASAAWSPSAASGMGGQNDAGRPALLRRSQHCHHPLGPAGGGNAGCTHTRAAKRGLRVSLPTAATPY